MLTAALTPDNNRRTREKRGQYKGTAPTQRTHHHNNESSRGRERVYAIREQCQHSTRKGLRSRNNYRRRQRQRLHYTVHEVVQ